MDLVNMKDCTFEIIIGTYEEFVLGYIFKDESKELVESFATHSHQGSVRCIACTNNLVASGGSDEVIQLYNMTNRKEAGTILQHTGTVTDLQFTPEQSHLISCSEDGSVAIYRVGSWQMEKVWTEAHKGTGVSSIAIHPSSKLALTLGQNKSLRTWNLIKGRPAYISNLSSLGKYMDLVIWSSEGSYYAVSCDNKIYIFDVQIAGVISTIDCSSRVTCMAFFTDDVICFGEENGWIISHSVTSNTELWRIKVGDGRVKCLSNKISKWFVTANSNGEIIVWELLDIRQVPSKLSSRNIDCRVTCMNVRVPVKIENP